MVKFELYEQEFIELNKLLKLLNLVETGGEAKLRIEQGEVKVNGVVEYRKRNKLRKGDIVVYGDEKISII
jgi:ribosome-associated protein